MIIQGVNSEDDHIYSTGSVYLIGHNLSWLVGGDGYANRPFDIVYQLRMRSIGREVMLKSGMGSLYNKLEFNVNHFRAHLGLR